MVADPSAGPLWARFYEIGTNRPMFVGRDGIVHDHLADIEQRTPRRLRLARRLAPQTVGERVSGLAEEVGRR